MLESAFFLPPKAENLSLTLVTTRTIIMEKTIKRCDETRSYPLTKMTPTIPCPHPLMGLCKAVWCLSHWFNDA